MKIAIGISGLYRDKVGRNDVSSNLLAMKNKFIPVTFGSNRLRTETAALYACAIANVVNS